MPEYDLDGLLNEILDASLDAALKRLAEAARRDGYPAVIRDYPEPVLQRTGKMWIDGTISLAQSYIAGKVAENVLKSALEDGESGTITTPRGTAVLGNIEDDFHALGRRMVASFLRLDGWEIVDLGNDVSPGGFVDAALEREARIIGVSAMMLSTALNIRSLREELDRRNLSGLLPLAVGGAVFNMRPGLVEEVGGDGTAPSAMDAPALFRTLCEKSTAGGAANGARGAPSGSANDAWNPEGSRA